MIHSGPVCRVQVMPMRASLVPRAAVSCFFEDFQVGAKFDSLTVVNPFAPQVHEPKAVSRHR